MKRKYVILLLLISSISFLFSQVDTIWTRTYESGTIDKGMAIGQKNDRGFSILGYEDDNENIQQYWLISTDEMGNIYKLGSFNNKLDDNDIFLSGIINNAGGYVLFGSHETRSPNQEDIMLININDNHKTLWTKTYNGGYFISDIPKQVIQTNDDGYAILSYRNYSYEGNNDEEYMVIKTNSLGDTLWTKKFKNQYNCYPVGLVQTDDNCIIVGGTKRYYHNDRLLNKTWLTKINPNGNIVWDKIYDDIIFHDMIKNPLCKTFENGFILKSQESFYKFDSSGTIEYSKNIPYIDQDCHTNSSISNTKDGGFLLATSTNNNEDILLIKTDSNFDTLWTKIIIKPKNENGVKTIELFDGCYAVLCNSMSSDNPNSDILLVKTTQDIPTEPFGLTVSYNANITINWENDYNRDIKKYYVYKDLVPSAVTLIDSIAGEPPARQYIDNNIEIGRSYYYRIKSANSFGIKSDFSKEVIGRLDVPPVWILPADSIFLEDEQLEINLNDFVSDQYDEDSVLTITASGNYEISCQIDPITHVATFMPNKDVCDINENIILTATDPWGLSSTDTLNVFVQPVNDAPAATLVDVFYVENETKLITLKASTGPSNESDQTLTYILRSLPEYGHLYETESGAAITLDDLPLTLSDNSIYYYSPEKFVQTSFVYSVQDDGGTEYGGIDTSLYQEVTLTFNVATKYNLATSGSIEGGVTILGNNTLYVPSSGDKVYRFDTTGTVMYSLNVNGNIKSSTTITPNHNVYIASTDYNLYSFNANGVSNSGWPKALGAEATASVAIDNSGNCYIGTGNGIFQCIAPDGTMNWSYNVGAAVYASAAISGDNILYVVNGNGRVYAFDLSTLNPSSISPKWTYEISEAVSSSPALDLNNNLYITTEEGSIIKLHDNGTIVTSTWNIDTEQKYIGSPVISSNGYLFIGGEAKILNAVNIVDGDIVWQDTLSGKVKSTISLNEQGTGQDRLYVGDDTGKLYAITLTNGEIIWQYQASSAINCPLLYVNDHVYFGTISGDIVSIEDKFVAIALEKRSAILTPIWPTFQGNNQRTGTQMPTTSTVYPGDTNNDGTVDELDVLPIGVYFLEEGGSRTEASSVWEGQDVTSWPSYPANYADCNGDGSVDEKDIIPIGINWGSTHDNSMQKFMINPNDKQMLAKHKEAFEMIYNSVDGIESTSAKAIRQLLETTLEIIPSSITLFSCYPNPFNPTTEIRFSLPREMTASLKVYDINGKHMTTLINGTELGIGYHQITFNGDVYPSGMYIYVLESETSIQAQKMMLIK